MPDGQFRPIFVCGAGRSGTTLVADMLGHHPDISPVYETDFVVALHDILFRAERRTTTPGDRDGAILALMDDWSRSLPRRPHNKRVHERYRHGPHHLLFDRDLVMRSTRSLLDQLEPGAELPAVRRFLTTLFDAHARLDGKPHWLTKTPSYVEILPFLRDMFPDLLVIHCVRDGRDVALSVLTRPWGPRRFSETADWWAARLRPALAFEDAHPDLVLRVRYEDLVRQPREQLDRMLAAVGVPSSPGLAEDYLRAPFGPDPSRAGQWRTRLSQDQVALFEGTAKGLLERLGYDLVAPESLLTTEPGPSSNSATPPPASPAPYTQRLSLCMIVKNEEHMLPACLDSVREHVDEMMVLDTGSADGTVRLAREAGARVVEHTWKEDFAEARNACLELARGDWILVLDADERLAPGSGSLLRAAIELPDLDCLALHLHNATSLDAPLEAVVSGRQRHGEPILLPRLFRRTPGLRWQRPVHENVDHWIERRPERCASVEAHIVHYGMVPEYRHERSKGERNIALLEACLERDGDDLHAAAYLASEYLLHGRLEQARRTQQRAWSALLGRCGTDVPEQRVVRLAQVRVNVQLLEHDFAAALETLTLVEKWGWEHPDLHFLHGQALELVQLFRARGPDHFAALRESERRYGLALAQRGAPQFEDVIAGTTGGLGQLRRAAVLLGLGRYEVARRSFLEALEEQPSSLEASLGVIECEIALGDQHSALERLRTLPPEADSRPDPAVLAACAHRASGDSEQAGWYARLAAQEHPRGFLSPHRALILGAFEPGAPRGYLFIGGAGRSGTTLFRAMLGSHRGFECGPETKLVHFVEGLHRRAEELQGTLEQAGIPPDRVEGAIRAFVEAFLGEADEPGVRLAEKTPHNVLWIGLLARLFPDAQFIHIVRDGRAVAASLVEQDWCGEDGQPLWYCRSHEAAAGYWDAVVQRARYESVCAPGRTLEIRYEDLVTDPEHTMRRVLDFTGAPWDPAVLEHHRTDQRFSASESSSAQARRPLYTDALERWRGRLSPSELETIEAVAGPLLHELGYTRAGGPPLPDPTHVAGLHFPGEM